VKHERRIRWSTDEGQKLEVKMQELDVLVIENRKKRNTQELAAMYITLKGRKFYV
jgi:hypothetical protein